MHNTPAGISHDFGENSSRRTGALHRICAQNHGRAITEDTMKGSGKDEDGQNEGAVKETKNSEVESPENQRRQTASVSRLGERLLRWSVSPINSRFLAARGISARIHANTHSHVRERYHWWVGRATKAQRKRDECREESHRVSGVETREGGRARRQAQGKREKEKEQASGTEKLWAKLSACWRRSVGPR